MTINVRGKSVKLLEDNVRECLSKLQGREKFLKSDTNPTNLKEQITILDYIKIKNLTLPKEIIQSINKPQKWEKRFATYKK